MRGKRSTPSCCLCRAPASYTSTPADASGNGALTAGHCIDYEPRGHERDMVRACVCRERSSEHRLHWQAASVGDAEGTRRSTLGVPDVYY